MYKVYVFYNVIYMHNIIFNVDVRKVGILIFHKNMCIVCVCVCVYKILSITAACTCFFIL